MSETITLILDKMPARLENDRAIYYLTSVNNDRYCLNDYIGHAVSIEFTGHLHCMDCKKLVKKFYAPGLCYVCMMSSALNSECIIRPELCEAHLGKGRVPEWEAQHHNKPHIVYLANSGGLKVGVTRVDQIPNRWIDQGADEAIILALTPYRQLAGQIEVALKGILSDKTNWRAMLKNMKDHAIDLLAEKKRITEWITLNTPNFEEFIAEDNTVYTLNYPTIMLNKPINSVKLDKQSKLEGILSGIKGQYLILDEKTVLNIRSHAGYEVHLKVNS